MGKGLARLSTALVLSLALFAAGIGPAAATPPQPPPIGDQPTLRPGTEIPDSGTDENFILLRDEAFIAGRTAGDNPLTPEQAGDRHGQAAGDAEAVKAHRPSGVVTFNGAWAGLGPNPIAQIQRSDGALTAESGRIGALAIRKSGRFILGAAQGGIWTYDGGVWVPHTDSLPSLAIGALAIAPSNDLVVYAGTGEGALSGDSYFGNGILKSTDGGTTWSHVSGDFFRGVAVSRLAIDPNDAGHLYASILRGRGGAHRTSPPIHSAFGVWESKDGGVSWTLLMGAPAGSLGATELRIDPQSPNLLYTSFWSDKIYKSTDGGQHWAPAMNGLPNGNFAASATRFDIGLSHPSGMGAVLYTGFDWVDAAGAYHQSHIFKSTDNAASWAPAGDGVGIDRVVDYCGQQCFYDNVIEADPQNPNVVFVAGQFGYGLNPPSGGVFRSDDGGATWINLGWDMHPDFHALAFDPSSPKHILIGNDGGVWESPNRGGRKNTADKLSNVDWIDLNGTVTVDPNTGAILVLHRTNLQIAQFSSIQTVPQNVNRFWGGTQDNGTLRKSSGSQTWFDVSSGDGGMVQVDQTDHSGCALGPSCFVYGNYFGVQPYRYSDGGNFFTNAPLRNGINTRDRSEFYLPEVLNQQNTNQYFLGTYRLYRTNNAKAPSASDVKFQIISPDLTSGCTGPAPNGARNCTLTAIGIGGGTAVYTGSNDGLVYISPDAQTSDSPTWIKLDHSGENGNEDGDHEDVRLPDRPVSAIAVDRSNYRIAYIAYNGFNAATPMRPGHVFKTSNGGQSFDDITGNLPDSPVNSLVLDPSYPKTLYAGTDFGPFVTYNGGRTWFGLGTGFPTVAIDQLDLDTYHRVIAAGTHGRGAWKIADTSPAKPALVLSKADAGIPVGPASNIDYTITVSNIGNAAATGVRLTDPIPENTKFVSADSGGRGSDEDSVIWSGLTIPSGGKVSVHLRVKIDANLEPDVKSIVNDGFKARSAEGPSTTGSPTVTPIAPAHAVTVTPATQTDGAHTGKSVTYQVTVSNRGFKSDSFNLSSSGGTYAVTFFNAACATPMSTTPVLTAGQSTTVCVKVAVPASARDSQVNTATVTATSSGDATVSASATVKTIAVAVDTLVVDDDSATSGSTDVNGFYTAALQANTIAFQLWDLSADRNLPLNYLTSFKNVVWFTGNTFPAPIGRYEGELKAFLDGGGRIFISGQDLLDQTGGTTSFVHDYLHVTWDGSETQNDKATKHVHGVGGTLTAGITTVGIDDTVLGNDFMDEITPNGTALSIFTDDAGQPDGLQFSGAFKVVFIAFPFEEYGSAGDKAALMGKVFTFLTT